MGWLTDTTPTTKKEFIQRTLNSYKDSGFNILGHKSTAQGLYIATKKDNKKFLICALVQKHEGCYGIKTMDESMGPAMNDCPPRLFKLVGEAPNEWAEKFREGCIENFKKKQWRPVDGEIVTIFGKKYSVISKIKPQTYNVRSLENQMVYSTTIRQMRNSL